MELLPLVWGFFWGDEDGLELGDGNSYITLNTLKPTKLHPLKWFGICVIFQ